MIWCTCRWFLWIWFLWINLWCDWALASDASMRSVSTTTTHSVPRWIYSESNPYLCDEPKNPVSSKWLGLWYTVSINYEWNGNAESFCTVAEFSTYGVCDGEFSLFVLSANGHCPTPWMHVLQNTSMLKYTYLKKEFERLTLVRTPPIVVMDDESGLQPFKFKFTLA